MWVRAALIGLLVIGPTPAFAGDRQMAAIAPPSDGTIERLLEQTSLPNEDWVYQDLVSKPDAGITKSYDDTWRYHEMRSNYTSPKGSTEFQAIGALSALQPTQEKDVRSGFAQGVLRMRVDAMLRGVLAPVAKHNKAAGERIQKVQGQLEKLKSSSISFSAAKEAPRIQFGYDVFTDASKLEVVTSQWGAGVYHARLLGSFSGTVPNTSLSVRVSAQVSALGGAALSFMPQAQIMEASFSRQITRHTTAQIATSQPTSGANPSRYSLSFAYQF